MINEILYFSSNIILTLYGVLIKSISDVSLNEQILFRAIAFIIITTISNGTSTPFTTEAIALSFANFLSIWGIYYGFKNMPISFAQGIFFSWPVFYYLLSKNFNLYRLLILTILFVLIFNLTQSNGNLRFKNILPISTVLVSIITHIAIFHYFKTHSDLKITQYLFIQYIWILVGLVIYYLVKGQNPISTKSIYILLFNLLLGYLGFYLQFQGVRTLSNYSVSIISFMAILVSILLDNFFYGNNISKNQLVSIILIILISSNYFYA